MSPRSTRHAARQALACRANPLLLNGQAAVVARKFRPGGGVDQALGATTMWTLTMKSKTTSKVDID